MNVLNIMSAPDLTRTHPAHTGTAPLTGFYTDTDSKNLSRTRKSGTFESFLLEAVNGVNDKQLEVGRVQEQLITDPDSVDIHDVTTAMAKAQMSLNLAQTVIDRLTTAWNEIQTTR